MSKKVKPPRPTDRDSIFEQVRTLLAETYDCGICVVSWEAEGETFHMDFSFGNHYAAKTLARDAEEILWPVEEEEKTEDDEEEEEA